MKSVPEYSKWLPEDASFSFESGLKWKDRYIGNFVPHVFKKSNIKMDGLERVYVKLSLHYTDGDESEPKILSVDTLCKIDVWLDIDDRCQIDPDCTRAGHYLTCIVRYSMSLLNNEPIFPITRLGTNMVNGIPVYCRSNKQYWPENVSIPDIMLNLPISNLDIDVSLSEIEAVKEMLKVVRLSADAGKIIFSHVISNTFRFVFDDAIDKVPCCVLIIVTDSGGKKTTYSTLQAQIYCRDNGIAPPTQLEASFPATKHIITSPDNCDTTLVIDDFFSSGFDNRSNDLNLALDKLVRLIGNQRSPARIKGGVVTEDLVQCGVIVTSEVEVGSGSGIVRSLIATITKPFDRVLLQECLEAPLAVPTFYHFLIIWYINNYFKIKNTLKKWLNDHRKNDLGVHDRLQESFYFLSASYKLFLWYCIEKGYTQLKSAHTEYNSFRVMLLKLIIAQDTRFKKSKINDEENTVDYLKLIDLLRKGENSVRLTLAKSSSVYKTGRYDGFYHNDKKLLCVRTDRLLLKIRNIIPQAKRDDVIKALKTAGALEVDKDVNTKKVCGERVLVIKVNKIDK